MFVDFITLTLALGAIRSTAAPQPLTPLSSLSNGGHGLSPLGGAKMPSSSGLTGSGSLGSGSLPSSGGSGLGSLGGGSLPSSGGSGLGSLGGGSLPSSGGSGLGSLGSGMCLAGGASTVQASKLGSYNVDPASVSVSGLSAGGFMSAQLGIAYSDVFRSGFGVFAGGPFDCARSQAYSSCMNNNLPSITQAIANMKAWSGQQIAATSNLAARKIFMWVGSSDITVGPKPMGQLKAQLANFDNAANTTFITANGAAHTFPTDSDSAGDSPCSTAACPYISNCGYDGAGAVLQWIYGTLKARNTGSPSGQMTAYSQTGSYGAGGMDTAGYIYVPKACGTGASCKLHVALHGCFQSHSQIGDKFTTNTGYTKWADTNNIILLFPQAIADYTSHTVWSGSPLPQPNACFDWVGWYGSNADQIGGAQMVAIINAVKQIMSGPKTASNNVANNSTGSGTQGQAAAASPPTPSSY